jgi:hypothetical protein
MLPGVFVSDTPTPEERRSWSFLAYPGICRGKRGIRRGGDMGGVGGELGIFQGIIAYLWNKHKVRKVDGPGHFYKFASSSLTSPSVIPSFFARYFMILWRVPSLSSSFPCVITVIINPLPSGLLKL